MTHGAMFFGRKSTTRGHKSTRPFSSQATNRIPRTCWTIAVFHRTRWQTINNCKSQPFNSHKNAHKALCYAIPTGNLGRWKFMLEEAYDGTYAYDVGNPYVTGMAHDFTRGFKAGTPFWIMEQQAAHINWGEYNPAPRPNILHLWLWHNFASGVETTMFFRERATWFAPEQYHSDLLNHDGSWAQGYFDLLSFKEQNTLMQVLRDTLVENEIALLVSLQDMWALQIQPHHKNFSYWNLIFTWFAALRRAGMPCNLTSTLAAISKYKLVIAQVCISLMNHSQCV